MRTRYAVGDGKYSMPSQQPQLVRRICQAARFFDKHGRGRRLENKRKGVVLINRDDDRNDKSRVLGGFNVYETR